jgi:hypothetical protein
MIALQGFERIQSIPDRDTVFPLTSASGPALGPTQPPVQWVPGPISPGVKRGRGVMQTTHPLLVPRLRKSRSYTSCHPNAPLWSVTGPLYPFFYSLDLYVGTIQASVSKAREKYDRIQLGRAVIWWSSNRLPTGWKSTSLTLHEIAPHSQVFFTH